MKIAVEGCAHGELDKIYECIEELQRREGIQVDLLICCGDFQSVRNNDDLRCMAVPDKFKHICTFYKYYSGEKRAPILTLFIGGNHEASNYLQELPYGGWVAPNIYYVGRAGVVRFGNVRIGGLSGIFKGRDYLQGLWECPPYNNNSLRSVYHVRALDVFRLRQLGEELHVMLSHDWPRGITDYGDKEQLLRRKPFLREDIESNQLGSLPAEELLRHLRPRYWFAAHLHCQFAAIVPHHDGDTTDETKFLALDKCLPRRRHLQILDIPNLDGDKRLRHDAEWLAVLRNTNHLLTVRNMDCHMPGPGGTERYNFLPNKEEKEEIIKLIGDKMLISEDAFVKTAPIYVKSAPGMMPEPISNPQTVYLCETLNIDDPLQVLLARTGRCLKKPHTNAVPPPEPCTPKRQQKLNLPSPTTPIVMDAELYSNRTDPSETALTTDVDSTIYTDTSIDTSLTDCTTPTTSTGGPKKTFKRRNQSIYTPDVDDSLSLESLISQESDTPKSTKLAFRRNHQSYKNEDDSLP